MFVRLNIGLLIIAVAGLWMFLADGKRSNGQTKKIIRIEAFQNCQDRPNKTEYLSNHNYMSSPKILRVKTEQYINGDYIVNRPVSSMIATVHMMKCETRDVSTCEFVMRIKIPNLCERLSEKNQLWTPLMDSIHPTISCPLRKQAYHIVNGSFSGMVPTPLVSSVPGGGENFWAVKLTYSDVDNVEAGCLYVSFKFYQVKVKQ